MPPCFAHPAFRAAYCLAAFCSVASQACGGTQAVPDPPEVAATRAAQARVARSVGRAANTQASQLPFQTWIRFNPAPCDCPRWELQIYGNWERMEPAAARDADASVSEVLAYEGFTPGALLWADVLLAGDTVADAQGWVYPVYDVRRLSEDPDSF